ncbi:MAG TPA: glutathione peroxidase [Chitinophagales bacterium]
MSNAQKNIYDFTVKNIDGKDVNLSEYKGKVVVIVNVASKCGLTPQYESIEAFYEKYKDKGVVVLGFPANNFMGQEPGTEAEIKTFCSTKYNVTFPMFSKVSVKGKDIAPLYAYLTEKKANGVFDADVQWNFQKFIVDKSGNLIQWISPKTTVDDPDFLKAIDYALLHN